MPGCGSLKMWLRICGKERRLHQMQSVVILFG
jgi:hypothetical protein